MRIEVDTGGLSGPDFTAIAHGVAPAGPMDDGALSSAAGSAGDPTLAAAMTDLGTNLTAALSAAGVTLGALGAAVDYAASAYTSNEGRISRAAR